MEQLKQLGAMSLILGCVSGCIPPDTSVSGKVTKLDGSAIVDVNLKLSGDISLLNGNKYIGTNTNGSGDYSYEELPPDGNYTITPVSDAWQFEPTSRTILSGVGNIEGASFIRYEHKLWYIDVDGDDFGSTNSILDVTDKPGGYVSNDDDCNDNDIAINPGQGDSIGDGVDNDCDGADRNNYYKDYDGDGQGNPAVKIVINEDAQPAGYIKDNQDCDDLDSNAYVGAAEIADDGIDQDCNGFDAITYYEDSDSDTYGNAAEPGIVADGRGAPAGYEDNSLDCNDTDIAINPDATEINSNGIDEDCDGHDRTVWYADADNDNYPDDELKIFIYAVIKPVGYAKSHFPKLDDCDDGNPAIRPFAAEVPENDIDENCDGEFAVTWFYDGDGDGHGDAADSEVANYASPAHVRYAGDCDDSDATRFPGADETDLDGIDQDCDGHDSTMWWADADGDGYGDITVTKLSELKPAGYVDDNTDCNDDEPGINPGETDLARDGIDQDCDGADSITWYADTDGDGYGDAGVKQDADSKPADYVRNDADCDDGDAAINPEAADDLKDDGIDQNCNGFDLQTLYRDADGDSYGAAAYSILVEGAPANYVGNSADCNDLDASIFPSSGC